MANLDNLDEISKLDKSNLLGSIEALPDQLQQAWDEILATSLSEQLLSVKNVVISGMGGSALGGRVVDSLILDRAITPIEVSTEFRLPNYVGPETLVVISSYSGNTEETLLSAQDALKKNAKVFVITTGGKLAELVSSEGLPAYIFEPKHNPSNQPRMGVVYSIGAVLALLSKGKYLHFSLDELNESVQKTRRLVSEYSVRVPLLQNPAKNLANTLREKAIVLVASEHLLGTAHAFKNQLNENSKTFSVLFDIPELNHHLMEGLAHPRAVKPILHFVLFNSKLYSPEVQKRYPLTAEVIEKNDIAASTIELQSSSKLEQIFEVLVLGEYVSFYLSMLYDIDPAPIPWVDYFKKKLAKG
jgi:glucose/mannose-6-phosphate isomerase